MNVVSWNLNGLDDTGLDVRTEAAMAAMLLGCTMEALLAGATAGPLPEVVLLQEVVPRTLHAHVLPHLLRAGFTVFPPTDPGRNYFEVIAVRAKPVRCEAIPFTRTGMGRVLQRVELTSTVFYTAHLESLKGGAPARLEQAQQVLDTLGSETKPAFFAGDTNLRESESESLRFPPGVADAWTLAGRPSAHKGTWKTARFDRAWVKGLTVTGFQTFGREAIEGVGPPSDHLGLRITVEA